MTSTSAMPTWGEFMAPSLRALLGGATRRTREICELAADELGIPHEARRELIPSGQPRYLS